MDNLLNGLTSVVSNVIDAFTSGVTKLFNMLVVLNDTTHAVEGLSVVGWFIILGIALGLVGKAIAFFSKYANRK